MSDAGRCPKCRELLSERSQDFCHACGYWPHQHRQKPAKSCMGKAVRRKDGRMGCLRCGRVVGA